MFLPQGFSTFYTSCGIKDQTLDLGVVHSQVSCNAAVLFTQNKVTGAPIQVGRKHIKNGRLQTVIVNSKNANVATGEQGYQIALDICQEVAKQLNIDISDVLPSSTGVIGRRLPVERIITALDDLKEKLQTPADFEGFAKSIMTTDTQYKMVSAKVDNASIVGVAKGAGMIEPNMATMLAYFFTDAKISAKKLHKCLKKANEVSFNSLSIDTDTSTSDTVAILANGVAGKVDTKNFEKTLQKLAIELTKKIAQDAEGATKLFIVDVIGAASNKDARKIGKSIINSPLVKTAIYQGDPNWGRIMMAVGKAKAKVKAPKIKIKWGVPSKEYLDTELEQLSAYLRNNHELHLTVELGLGKGKWRVYGCDLTEEYVKINAFYTT